MAGGYGASRQLDQTPTWALARVCTVIIIISIALEKLLHKAGTCLTQRHKKALFEALEKVKTELMVLGFISLTLVFSQYYIAGICIPEKVGNSMLPCASPTKLKEDGEQKLIMYERRVLAAGKEPTCAEGHVALISVNGLHQIHILIFFLAVFHVFYSAVTMALGRLQIRGWKKWEEETLSHQYEFSNDQSRFRFTHETSFVKSHIRFWTKLPIFYYIGCFFRQFFRSVSKSDYLTLRNGFISLHLARGSKFNFQKYIMRSLDDDFKSVVGSVLWGSFVVFLLINVDGWKALFWASLIPVIIILLVGTKLQMILTRMAVEITERHSVVPGIPLVQGSDKYFWFSRPQLVFHLIHFALFQNAFQITYFFWIWYEYGLNSCFHDDLKLLIAKISLGLGVLVLCSYITLPLYALIVQMGSTMKKSIFDEETSKALKKWHMAAKKKPVKEAPARTFEDIAGPSASSTGLQAGPSLNPFRDTGHSTQSEILPFDEEQTVDLEDDVPGKHQPSSIELMVRVDHVDETDISFSKE